MSERDRQVLCRAAAQAKRRNPSVDAAAFGRRSASAAPERPTAIVIVPALDRTIDAALANSSPPPPPSGREVWKDTCLLADRWIPRSLKNLFTGQVYSAADFQLEMGVVLSDFPVALLSNV